MVLMQLAKSKCANIGVNISWHDTIQSNDSAYVRDDSSEREATMYMQEVF